MSRACTGAAYEDAVLRAPGTTRGPCRGSPRTPHCPVSPRVGTRSKEALAPGLRDLPQDFRSCIRPPPPQFCQQRAHSRPAVPAARAPSLECLLPDVRTHVEPTCSEYGVSAPRCPCLVRGLLLCSPVPTALQSAVVAHSNQYNKQLINRFFKDMQCQAWGGLRIVEKWWCSQGNRIVRPRCTGE